MNNLTEGGGMLDHLHYVKRFVNEKFKFGDICYCQKSYTFKS